MSETTLLIIGCMVVSVGARTGGYLILSRFERIHFRVAAALDAVPAAVMTTLVVPAAVDSSWAEVAVLAATVLVATRLGSTLSLAFGMAMILLLRAI